MKPEVAALMVFADGRKTCSGGRVLKEYQGLKLLISEAINSGSVTRVPSLAKYAPVRASEYDILDGIIEEAKRLQACL